MVEVSFDDDGLGTTMRYLANGALQPVEPQSTLRYEVTGRGPYDVREDGHHVGTLARPDDVLYVLYGRCHARLLDHLAATAWVSLHAAVVEVAGRRLLLSGEKGSGKTTLALRLLHDGHRVEGDELVLTRDGLAMCLPRNFHVKPGTVELVPELRRGWHAMPATSTSDGMVIRAFNPAAAGFPCVLRHAPLDAAFFLRAEHRGQAVCHPLSSVELVRRAVASCVGPAAERAQTVRSIVRLLQGVDGYQLTVGDLRQTADLLTAVGSRPAEAVCYHRNDRMEVVSG